MKMMKDRKIATRAVGLILIMALLLASCVAFAEDDDSKGVEFEAELTNCIDMSVGKWFATSENRALLTLLLSLDLSRVVDKSEFDVSNAWLNRSYVAMGDGTLGVYLHGEKQDCIIIYSSVAGVATYVMHDICADSVVRLTLSSVFEDGYYENSLGDMAEVAGKLNDALSDN